MLTLIRAQGIAPRMKAARQVNVWRDESGAAFAWTLVGEERHWIDWPALATFAFMPGGPDVLVWPASGVAFETIRERFTRTLQPIVLQTGGCEALHASGVRRDSSVVALCGPRFSGKSTLAYALSRDGFDQIADDAVTFRMSGGRIEVLPLPYESRLRLPSRQFFGVLSESSSRDSGGTDTPWHLDVILSLRQDADSREPHAERIPPHRAFAVLLEQAYYFDRHDSAEARRLVDDYLVVAERVPVVALTYRPDFADLAGVVRLIAEVIDCETGSRLPSAAVGSR